MSETPTTIEDVAKHLARTLKTTVPTDEIIFNKDELDELIQCVAKVLDNKMQTSVLIMGGFPLYDFEIILNYLNNARIRFCFPRTIADKSIDDVKQGNLPDDYIPVLGAIKFNDNQFMVIHLNPETKSMGMSNCLFDRDGDITDEEITEKNLRAIAHFVCDCWLAVQVALLNPQTKEVFSNPKIVKRKAKKDRRSGEKRITRYIRRHVIDGDKIRSARKASINRHCKAWLVIGHWRHYKNGKKVFIKPYWKGELRELQTNLDKGRIRQISTEKQH